MVLRVIAVPKRRTSPQGASPSRPVIPIRCGDTQTIAGRRRNPRLAVGKQDAHTKERRDRDGGMFAPKSHCHFSCSMRSQGLQVNPCCPFAKFAE